VPRERREPWNPNVYIAVPKNLLDKVVNGGRGNISFGVQQQQPSAFQQIQSYHESNLQPGGPFQQPNMSMQDPNLSIM